MTVSTNRKIAPATVKRKATRRKERKTLDEPGTLIWPSCSRAFSKGKLKAQRAQVPTRAREAVRFLDD